MGTVEYFRDVHISCECHSYKTIKNKRHLYLQTSVRKGKKVLSIMEYNCALGAIAVAAASPGRTAATNGNRPTDTRHIKHQEESDRELFHRDRAQFNVKQQQDYERQNRGKVKAAPIETDKDRGVKEVVSEFKERMDARESAKSSKE